jgi:hypothetical protein
MKRWLEGNTGFCIRIFAVSGLSLLLYSGISVGAELRSYPERPVVEAMTFDVEGGVDAVNVDSAGATSKPRNVIVDGRDYAFTDDAEFFDRRGNVIESDAVIIGKHVGLVLDPGNRILKLFVLKEQAQVTSSANQQKEQGSNKQSKAHDGTMTFEGGVWKN